MLPNAPPKEISLASDQAVGQKFAGRMFEAVKRVVNHTLERGIRDLSILGNNLADAAKCALEGVENMMVGIFSDMDALVAEAEGLT